MTIWILIILGMICCLCLPTMPIVLLWGLLVYYAVLGGTGLYKLIKNKIFISSVIAIIISIVCLTLTQSMLSRKIGDENTGYSNLIRLRAALDKYLEIHDGVFPPSETWCDEILKVDDSLSRNNFIIPKIQEYECNFAYNKNLESLNTNNISEDVVVIFMSEGGWNLSGSEELLNNIEGISTYVLLSDGTIWRCRFPERQILRYNKNTKESYRVQLRWRVNH